MTDLLATEAPVDGLILCCKCGEEQPVAAFYRKKGKLARTWCKACYRAWHRARYTPSTGATDDPRNCGWCDQVFQPRRRQASTFCSRSCKDHAYKAVRRDELVASKPSDRACLHCATPIAQARRSDAMFCSAQCNSAAHQVTRQNAKKAGEKRPDQLQFRAVIAERDGWMCGLCSKKVDPSLRHPDPMYGSIDHVVPLAAGGSNELVNLQLAHLVCNLRKRHMGPPTQLSLLVVGPRVLHARDRSHHEPLQKAGTSCPSF